MFTKIANGILGLGIAAGIIGSLVGGIIIGKDSGIGYGFLVVLGGLVTTLIAFTGFGLIVELANNIKACRDALERMSGSNYGASYNPVQTSGWNNGVSNASVQKPNSGSSASYDLIQMVKNEQRADSWNCPRCQTVNSFGMQFCSSCGTGKPLEGWFCSKCGHKNELSRPYCVVCSNSRSNSNRKT